MTGRRILVIAALMILWSATNIFGGPVKSGHCPLKLSIKTCTPKCWNDFECLGIQRCCPNSCGSMSCSDVSSVFSGNNPREVEKGVVYCAGVKCLSGQKCVSASSMSRPKCM